MRQTPCKVRENLPFTLFSPFPGLRQALFRTAPGGGFRLRSWLFGGGGAERKKGKGKRKGGIHPQQGKRGAECPHFTVSYILVKLIKFFVEKVKEERII